MTRNDVTQILVDADHDPEGCTNLQAARIDMLEMIGDEDSLQMVRPTTMYLFPPFSPFPSSLYMLNCFVLI
jgi:hypothetical protein